MSKQKSSSGVKLPPGCGLDLQKPVLYNPYIHDPTHGFHAVRRLRLCSACGKIVTPAIGTLRCPLCGVVHRNNLYFPRVFKALHLRAGRRSGKSLAGAHAVREELLVPQQRWWACGPSFKILHDSTLPTLLRLIPPDWVKNWNQDNLELTLMNDSFIQFRSLDDPERGRGPGLHGVWLDEAAFIAQRAWDVLSPSLTENAGVVIPTTSPGGFDWTYDEFLKRALVDHVPGYWAAKFRTIDNPLFSSNPVLRKEIEDARKTKSPEFFAAEYEGEDVNFTGSIYTHKVIEDASLKSDDEVRQYIPEWPAIDSSRKILIGLDSGADHPFGAVMLVVTEKGIVCVGEYLERMAASITHLIAIRGLFSTNRFGGNVTWSANKNEAQLRLEFGLRGIGVVPAENRHLMGIQRVQSWLLTGQFKFVASRCPRTLEQMRAYRWADNYQLDGQKREQEGVFKKKDELPDAIRYALMTFPELPQLAEIPLSEREQKRWDALDEKSRQDIEMQRTYNSRERQKELSKDDPSWPVGEFFGGQVESLF